MSRTTAQVLASISGNQVPDGFAWNHNPTSNTMLSFLPLADFASRFEAAAEAQLQEATPKTANLMLGAYERILGPDTCLGDPATLTFDERRTSVSARWITPADPSVPGLTALAAAYGATVTITERRRNCCGVLRCGNVLRPHPQQYVFVVGMPRAQVRKFTCGVSHCGEPLGYIETNTVIECVIRRAAPLRTTPVFSYPPLPAAGWGSSPGWITGGWS